MKRIHSLVALATLATAFAFTTGCDKKEKQEELAPKAQELEADKPATEMATKFTINTEDTNVEFEMDAELEQIDGKAPDSVEGELQVDVMDVTKTTGLVKVDLLDLSIYQQKREKADGEFGEEEKNEKQNQDMRTWFQISEDAPEDVREKNRYAEFKIKKVENPSQKDITKLEGAERKITAEVTGDLRLHGRVTEQKFPVELTFAFAGDKPQSVTIKSKEPFEVSLDKHDVRPRKAFDQLADATLETLGAKVAKVAKVSIEAKATAEPIKADGESAKAETEKGEAHADAAQKVEGKGTEGKDAEGGPAAEVAKAEPEKAE